MRTAVTIALVFIFSFWGSPASLEAEEHILPSFAFKAFSETGKNISPFSLSRRIRPAGDDEYYELLQDSSGSSRKKAERVYRAIFGGMIATYWTHSGNFRNSSLDQIIEFTLIQEREDIRFEGNRINLTGAESLLHALQPGQNITFESTIHRTEIMSTGQVLHSKSIRTESFSRLQNACLGIAGTKIHTRVYIGYQGIYKYYYSDVLELIVRQDFIPKDGGDSIKFRELAAIPSGLYSIPGC